MAARPLRRDRLETEIVFDADELFDVRTATRERKDGELVRELRARRGRLGCRSEQGRAIVVSLLVIAGEALRRLAGPKLVKIPAGEVEAGILRHARADETIAHPERRPRRLHDQKPR